MPTMTEIREQRRLLYEKYGELTTIELTLAPRGSQPAGVAVEPLDEPVEVIEQPPKSMPKAALLPEKRSGGGNSVKLTNAQIAALAGLAMRYGTDWKRQLDQAIANYLALRDDMPEDEWSDLHLADEMRSELL